MQVEFIKWVYWTLVAGMKPGRGVPGVEHAFAEGDICMENYSKALDAYERLCKRLGSGVEDRDVEIIFNALLDNQEEIGYRMYRYGAKFGLNGERLEKE